MGLAGRKARAPMGPHLTSAVQVRDEIKWMVESGAITGEKADLWNARMKEEKAVELLRDKATAGDVANAGHLAMFVRGAGGMVIDPRRRQQRLTKRAVDAIDAVVETDTSQVDDLANQREPVRMHAG